jgi:hypothetical protein
MRKPSVLFVVLAVGAGCASGPGGKRLVIPDEMVRNSSSSSSSSAPASSSSSRSQSRPPPGDVEKTSAPAERPPLPPNKYIVRMAENGRVWEMELPTSAASRR